MVVGHGIESEDSCAHRSLARRFEAIVFDWDHSSASGRRVNARLIRMLVEQAVARGLELAVMSDGDVSSIDGELAARPDGPGGMIFALNQGSEIFSVGRQGPRLAFRCAASHDGDAASLRAAQPTDRSDSPRWIDRWLWERGLAPEQVLVIGEQSGTVSGGREVFAAVLEDQIARRRRGELPVLSEAEEWTLSLEGLDPLRERVRDSLLTLADGRLGTRGGLIVSGSRGSPSVLLSGVYTRTGTETHLLTGPLWNLIAAGDATARPIRRVLDLRTGVLWLQLSSETGELAALALSSLARPGTVALRARGRIDRTVPDPLLEPPAEVTVERGEDDDLQWLSVKGRPGSIAAAAHDRALSANACIALDRVAAFEGVARGTADHKAVMARAQRARRIGFDGLLCEHRRAWASRWDDSDVKIEGDTALQQAVRFALFHLMASVGDEGEAAVGARGLSGSAYRGHVFWDSDVYVLPFLAATHPPAARAMLEYRIRRLPEAMRIARAQGRAGARFPWESAWSGLDVTPARVRNPRGETVRVLTGELEEHIVADVAWAASCYIDWTGDEDFARGPGRELLVQTARWWASRIELDDHGDGHIRGVIGPDEYHAPVDDNAFTNVMARWNLGRGAAAGANRVSDEERRRWHELAERLVDGYDPETHLYEQFAGFLALEPLLIAEVARHRPVAADILLGSERTRRAQVVKQADVLMLHYLVPDEVPAISLGPNLEFYEPRTAHGSTLSPGVHAALFARAGRLDQALENLRLTARIDLDDIGHMTAGGLHLAAMGSVWRALSFGFAGLRPAGDALAIDPVLPPDWTRLEIRVQFRGSRVRLRIEPDRAHARATPPVSALTPAGDRIELTPGGQTFELRPPHPRNFP